MPLQPEQIDNLRVVSGNLEYFNGSSWVKLNEQTGSGPPVGSMMFGSFSSTPANYLSVNRATLSKTAYAELWDYANNNGLVVYLNPSDSESNIIKYIDVDASNFKLPDYRGLSPVVAGVNSFLQAGNGASLQAALAEYQKWMMQGHRHTIHLYTPVGSGDTVAASTGSSGVGIYNMQYSDVIIPDDINGTPETGGYTRGPGFGIGVYVRYQ